MGNYAGRAIVTTALFGLSMLVTIIVVAKLETPWKYAIAVVPAALLALTVYLVLRVAKTPDPAKQ